MPQLNVAPSPVAVTPPASANAASADSASSGQAADSPAAPFAAVLRQQVKQHSESSHQADKTAKAAPAALAPAADAKTADASQALPPDAIAAIAQMLSGIVPPAPGQQSAQDGPDAGDGKGKGKDKDTKTTAQDDANPMALALPALPVQTPVATPAQVERAADAGSRKTVPLQGDAPLLAEKLAAEKGQEPATPAAPVKDNVQDFAALLASARDAHGATPVHAAAGAEAASAHIDTPVGAHGWDNELGDKLTWMVNKNETHAELVLNPPDLGRIEVSISLKGDHASANFVSANPIVRDAIENAVPRLREILQGAGIALGQTQVGAESFQQSPGNRENGDNSRRGGRTSASAVEPVRAGGLLGGGATATLRRGNGMVDTFA